MFLATRDVIFFSHLLDKCCSVIQFFLLFCSHKFVCDQIKKLTGNEALVVFQENLGHSVVNAFFSYCVVCLFIYTYVYFAESVNLSHARTHTMKITSVKVNIDAGCHRFMSAMQSVLL